MRTLRTIFLFIKLLVKNPTSAFRVMRDIWLIRADKSFNSDYYNKNNPDVARFYSSGLVHFCIIGWKEGRNPNPDFNMSAFISAHHNIIQSGVNPLVYSSYSHKFPVSRNNDMVSVRGYIDSHFAMNMPFHSVKAEGERRINIVYGAFDKGVLFGGTATALIVANNLACNQNVELRIISGRMEPAMYDKLVSIFHLSRPLKVSFHDLDKGEDVDIRPDDTFIGTFWTTIDSLLRNENINNDILCIMQDIEPFFYEYGDYHLRCTQAMQNPRVIPIVNTKLLYDYLCANGYENAKSKGCYFEPAFPDFIYKANSSAFEPKEKYKLFFYARLGVPRNLFFFCADVLNHAFSEGILDPDEWDVVMAGDAYVPNLVLDCGLVVKNLGRLSWEQYSELASDIDLCFGVIYTPHPSYPPLDMAASGAVSLTNKFANKQDLSGYSPNIITADLCINDMLHGMKNAVKIAKDPQLRKKNYEASNYGKSWETSLQSTLRHHF